ncbi:hypothetical protein [Clostridium perfringens]|uniref:hypothetical protein n=1 Tax=Clostridium perfringens TaxID=1502 RepID=UPI00096A4C13|nr:hypothetical protein [Clostridium perfringens]
MDYEGIPIKVVDNLDELIRKSKSLGVLRGATVEQLTTTKFKNTSNEEMELEGYEVESIYEVEEENEEGEEE